jgi:tRNA-dihydrouridine synthase
VPVTIKFRKGIDDSLLTYLDAGRIGEGRGCARRRRCTRAPPRSSTRAKPTGTAIATLKQHVRTIPVLGNGDIFEAGTPCA